MEYGPQHAEYYDIVFRSRGKDWEAEAEELTRMIRSRLPDARSLLDVACGTGAHLETFRRLFDSAEGLELSGPMREVTGKKPPGLTVHAGDMRDFDLGRTFDAVTCMGNAVACVASVRELDAAIERMVGHLVTGGVLVVEPWWFPDNFIDGHVGGHLVREEGRVISRITRSTRQGLQTRMEVRFTIADSSGISDFTEVLHVSLFTREEYLAAFERAGCAAEFVPGFRLADGRPNGPGLIVGVRK
jgi:SAM-dependent methyltransferase